MSPIIKGNIRTRIFFGFMLVTLLSIIGVTVISYLVFKKKYRNPKQRKTTPDGRNTNVFAGLRREPHDRN